MVETVVAVRVHLLPPVLGWLCSHSLVGAVSYGVKRGWRRGRRPSGDGRWHTKGAKGFK